MELTKLLRTLVDERGSDLFLSVGIQPAIKVNGKLRRLGDGAPLNEDDVLNMVSQTMTQERYDLYIKTRESNFAITCPGIGRVRVSAFWQQDLPGCSIRRIETEIPTCEELFLPMSIKDLAMAKRGLILFVGATGAGKSTTQAAMIGYRNRHANDHILTIEDPVEFVHQHDNCLITQREVGTDTLSFDEGLKSALRQAPDVILIGEIRSEETMEFALSFAETGHLCMATLHANNANQAIERILHLVPPSKHRMLMYDLAFNMKAIIAQQLVPTLDGRGRRAAFEIMLNTPLISDILRKGEVHRLKETMSRSRELGMTTFDQSLFELYKEGLIGFDEALAYADSSNEVRMMIKLASGNRYDSGLMDNITVS
jgi:twitching motility protein PilU